MGDADGAEPWMFGPTAESQDEVGGPDDALVHKGSLNCWSLDACEGIVRDSLLCLRLLPHLFGTASYVFGKSVAQVVPMILHRTATAKPDVIA